MTDFDDDKSHDTDMFGGNDDYSVDGDPRSEDEYGYCEDFVVDDEDV